MRKAPWGFWGYWLSPHLSPLTHPPLPPHIHSMEQKCPWGQILAQRPRLLSLGGGVWAKLVNMDVQVLQQPPMALRQGRGAPHQPSVHSSHCFLCPAHLSVWGGGLSSQNNIFNVQNKVARIIKETSYTEIQFSKY